MEDNKVNVVEELNETDKQFEQHVQALYQVFMDNNELMSDTNNDKLNTLVQWAPDAIGIDTFLKVMYMKGMFYQGVENRNGARYCAMRMLQMKEILEHKTHKKPRYIDFKEFSFSKNMNSFITKYCEFLDHIYRSIRSKLLVISLILMAIAATTLVIFVQMDVVVAIAVAFVICGLNYVIQVRRLPKMFQKSQLKAIEEYIDGELLGFDLVYRK